MDGREALRGLARELGGATLAILVAVLALGRLGAAPYMLLVMPDSSMAPTLARGDLVVAARGDPQVGDIAVWCVTPFYCVVHRVVLYRGSLAVTKGDAKPFPDPPVPARLLRYRVVSRAPLLAWLPPLLALLGAAGYLWLYNGRDTPGGLAFRVLAFIVVLAVTATLLYPLSVSFMSKPFEEPYAALREIRVDGLEGRVVYQLRGLELVSVEECGIEEVAPGTGSWPCNATVAGDSVSFTVPREAWLQAVESGAVKLRLRLLLEVEPCSLEGDYVFAIAPQPLTMSREGRRLVFHNPNPVPVYVNITVYWADSPGAFNVDHVSVAVPPSSSAYYEAPVHRYVYVDVTYMLGGRNYRYRMRIG